MSNITTLLQKSQKHWPSYYYGMNQQQLKEAIIAATTIVKQDEVYIIGSQSILGTFSEHELPNAATRSTELDVLPIRDP